MMSMRTKLTGLSPTTTTTTTAATNGGGSGGGAEGGPESWELRPCGMLVQKRVDADEDRKPAPTIRVRVKFGSIYHDIYINSQATFGELKKMLTEPTGLHHQDQKVYYKGKEIDSKEFLDVVGIKDKSKLVLEEDPISQEKRFLEMRKSAQMEKAAKSISEISLEVDRLALQVTALESLIHKGGRVAEKEVVNLIELLMNELIKVDGITTDGDVKLQKKMQVRRVQKYVETLDVLKVKNSTPSANGQPPATSNVTKPPRVPQHHQPRHSIRHSPLKPKVQEEQPSRHSTSGTIVTTQWETFDSTPPLIPISPSSSPHPTSFNTTTPKFPWDVFV